MVKMYRDGILFQLRLLEGTPSPAYALWRSLVHLFPANAKEQFRAFSKATQGVASIARIRGIQEYWLSALSAKRIPLSLKKFGR